MAKIAIIYWSGTGHTQTMAECIAAGAKKAGADVSVFSVGDFNSASLGSYDKLMFGCPAMGAEELEPDEFEPFFASIESALKGRAVALFGSYEWAEGEWMKTWCARAKTAGAIVFEEGLIAYDDPDADAQKACASFGERFAKQ